MKLLLIFVGGGLGSLARYALSKWPGNPTTGFPWGTLSANLAACLILALVWGLIARKANVDEGVKAMILVGFCGGFSTFSTFSYETMGMIRDQKPLMAMGYVAVSVVICLGALIVGDQLARIF